MFGEARAEVERTPKTTTRPLNPCGEVRRRPFASGRVDEDEQSTQSRDTGALSLYVECRSWIAWRAFVLLREKGLDSSSTRVSSGPS